VTLFEDDPYRDLAYDPCERRPICARLRRASWIYQGSFSKTMAPGLRIGFLAASPDLFPHLVKLKQAADLHTNRISQWSVLQHLNDPNRPARLAGIVDRYRQKRDLFAAAMGRHLSGRADWEVPAGGLFFWARLKGQVDTEALLEQALKRNVAFMPGDPFQSAAPPHAPAIRLNFSHASSEAADKGLAVIGELLAEVRQGALA
jgi:2-aminoadipate transaminase